jgi:hypothetical protein
MADAGPASIERLRGERDALKGNTRYTVNTHFENYATPNC